jgi:PAS domain S-box-containing protein
MAITAFSSEDHTRALEVHDKGLALILSIGKTMLKAKSLADVLNTIVTGAMELTHTDAGVIFLLDADCKSVLDKFHPPGGFSHPDPRLSERKGITRQIILTRRPVFLCDISHNARVNPALKARYKCMFGIPLLQDGFVLGVLYLNGRTPRDLTKTERSLLRALVDHAVLAIQIKNAEAMYHAIPQHVFLKDLKSRFRAANASFCHSLVKRGERLVERDLIGKTDFDFYDHETAQEYVARDRDVINTKSSKAWTEAHPGPKNQATLVHVVKSPVLNAAREVIGVQAIFWNITEQEYLRQRWESLVNQSPDSVVVHERARITFANPMALRLFGAPDFKHLENRLIYEFIDKRFHRAARRRLSSLIKKKPVKQGVRMKVCRPSGDPVDVEVYATPGPGPDEVQVVFHDVTHRNTLIAQVERTNKELAKALDIQASLLQEAHHRIKNNLKNVSSFLSMKGERFRGTDADEKAAKVLRECDCYIQVMILIHERLARSSSSSTIAMKDFLAELVDWLAHLYRAAARNITCSCDLQDVSVTLDDAVPCALAVSELVTNALKYAFPSQDWGNIRVTLIASGDRNVTVSVADNGIGLPTTISLSDPKSLGMTLVSRWVRKQLQGRLDVHTERGTCFTFQFRTKQPTLAKKTHK